MDEQSKVLDELLSQQTSATLLLNNTVQLGEKLYPLTSTEGREIINTQIQELQQALETLFDGINTLHRDIATKKERWVGFEEKFENISSWISDAELKLPQEIELKASLEEKRSQLQAYRKLLHDISSHQQDIIDLKDKVDNLPDKNEQVNKQLDNIIEKHTKMLKCSQNYVERYEVIVSDHQQFNQTVEDVHNWIDATHEMVSSLGDSELERITLQSNVERLKVRKISMFREYLF